jgi:hypothetical protein
MISLLSGLRDVGWFVAGFVCCLLFLFAIAAGKGGGGAAS